MSPRRQVQGRRLLAAADGRQLCALMPLHFQSAEAWRPRSCFHRINPARCGESIEAHSWPGAPELFSRPAATIQREVNSFEECCLQWIDETFSCAADFLKAFKASLSSSLQEITPDPQSFSRCC
jgi:hypothetical protein